MFNSSRHDFGITFRAVAGRWPLPPAPPDPATPGPARAGAAAAAQAESVAVSDHRDSVSLYRAVTVARAAVTVVT